MNIYVSPNGDDGNNGSRLSPIKTIEEAKNRVRQLETGDITVLLRGGRYQINETIYFGIEDGGNENKTVTYKAFVDEVPYFTSEIDVIGWEKADLEEFPEISKGKIYKAPFPNGITEVKTMFSGNTRLTRAHSEMVNPEKIHEYTRMDSLNVALESERPLLRRVDFKAGFIKKRPNMSDIELRFMPVPWTMNLLPLALVDEENSVATLAVEATTPLSGKPDGMRVENDPMYMTKEGFFCTNSQKREIYYFGEPKNIKTPSVLCFFAIEGDTDYEKPVDTPVKNLHFEGLEFAFSSRYTTKDGYKGTGIQHDWEMFDTRNSVIRFRGAEDCSLTNCHIHSTSNTAIRLDLHCKNILIKNNLIDDIGNMGILLCGYGPGTKDVNKNNIITNNIITRCGEEIWHGHAIFLWQSGENLVSHNKIHHSARKGIGLCGVRITILKRPDHKFDEASKTIRWNEIEITDENDDFANYTKYLHCRNNIIEKNNVYKVIEKIGDGSAINVSGAGTGNNIRENYIHHISTYFSSSVLRTDDWQSDTIFERNVIYKSNISGITRKNYTHIINNFIIDVSAKNGYIRFASYPNEKANYGSKIKNNIYFDTEDEMKVFGKGYLVSEGATLPENCEISNNIMFCKENNGCLNEHFSEVSEVGSKICDPLFKDIENEDFTFCENSPAISMGISEIDVKNTGITSEFPKRLLDLEYEGSLDDEYDRGKNPNKTQYNWW